jgi:5'-deoxynucleotidase YfbR-like HD superfamily hydrolase
MDTIDLVTMLREASRVERAHTLPHHGSYTNGQHQYDAVMLLFSLHPNPSMNLVKAVLTHDVGERWCGDIPAPAKWSDGEYAKRSQQLEARCLKSLGYDIILTEEERMWLKAVDSIELLLWAKDQIAMGNMNATVVVGNLVKHFLTTKLPKAAKEFVANHKWSRTSDRLPK